MLGFLPRSCFLFLAVVILSREAWGQCLTTDDTPRPASRIVQTAQQLLNGTQTFTFELLRMLHSGLHSSQQGLFFSPFSVWSALTITYMGAQGLTEQELAAVLGLSGLDKVAVTAAYNQIRDWQSDHNNISKENASYQFVNRILFQLDLPLRRCVVDAFADNLAFVDFHTSPESARLGVNKWIEQQTKGKIQDMLPAGSINALTKMMVANAVYFKKDWLNQFNPQLTQPHRFTVSFNEETLVNMMRTKGSFLYGVSEALQCTALDIPYTGKDLSMIVLLPQSRYLGLDALVKQITNARFEELIESMFPIDVTVALPKFRLDDSFELSQPLQSLGLKQLFNPATADLSGFTGSRDLTVTAIHHRAFIDVNEQGTEAAAATALLASRTARPAQPTTFIVDRPCLFFIRDNKSKLILFIGSLVRPSAKA